MKDLQNQKNSAFCEEPRIADDSVVHDKTAQTHDISAVQSKDAHIPRNLETQSEASPSRTLPDEEYMRLALELARRGCGHVSPNPMVGSVIVKDGRIIGQGWHQAYGQAHAERNALASCRESPAGATLYVTLEPCCHHGKQPPCTDAILEAGIARVVVGSGDPNPLVGGKGIALLRSHGVQVTEHVLEEECRKLNEIFFHYIQTKRPYVVMKYAMTLDGKIAAYTGASKWITGEEARNRVQYDRHRLSAIMVGVGTVLADDPMLTCRLEGGVNPTRIVCDSHLRTPLTSRIVQTASEIPTILATCCADPKRQKPYLDAGCRILVVRRGRPNGTSKSTIRISVPPVDTTNPDSGIPIPGTGILVPLSDADIRKLDRDVPASGHGSQVDLPHLMELLGAEGIDSILLEGGASLNWSALSSGIVSKVQTYLAPKLLGGETAKSPVGGPGFPTPDAGVFLTNCTVTRLGEDFLLESEVRQDVHRNY